MKKLSYSLLIAMLFVGITGCGGDSTGPDDGEPPQTPNLEQGQPDVSYFEENNSQKKFMKLAPQTISLRQGG